MDGSLLVHRNATDFWLPLYSATLLNMFIGPNNGGACVEYLGFSTSKVIPSVNRVAFISKFLNKDKFTFESSKIIP